MAHLPLRTPDDDLIPLLRKASSDDLGVLVEYIHRDRNEELSTVPAFVAQNPAAKAKVYDGDHRAYADDIAAEIQRYCGNTISNIYRDGKGVPYMEAVRDVADHLKVSYHKDATVDRIEFQIQLRVLADAYEKMSEEERKSFLDEVGAPTVAGSVPETLPVIAAQAAIRATGLAAYKIAVIAANAIAKAVLGRGLTLVANAALTRVIGALAGPVGWAATGLWTLYDLGGPAYRVLIPCVLHVAYIRRKICTCQKCQELQPATADFCPSCGAKMRSPDLTEPSADGDSRL